MSSELDEAIRNEATQHLNIAIAEVKKAQNVIHSESDENRETEEIINWLEELVEEVGVEDADTNHSKDVGSKRSEEKPTKFKA